MESDAAARLLERLEYAVRAFAVAIVSLEGELQRAQLVRLAFHRAEVLEVFGVAHEPSVEQKQLSVQRTVGTVLTIRRTSDAGSGRARRARRPDQA